MYKMKPIQLGMLYGPMLQETLIKCDHIQDDWAKDIQEPNKFTIIASVAMRCATITKYGYNCRVKHTFTNTTNTNNKI